MSDLKTLPPAMPSLLPSITELGETRESLENKLGKPEKCKLSSYESGDYKLAWYDTEEVKISNSDNPESVEELITWKVEGIVKDGEVKEWKASAYRQGKLAQIIERYDLNPVSLTV